MRLQKGWINRQFARVERDAQTWPTWMRPETEAITTTATQVSERTAATSENEDGAKSGETSVREPRDSR